jgi:hypothetical protein
VSGLLVHNPVPSGANPTGPDQGVIEEARRHQRARRIRTVLVTLIAAALIAVIGWALGGGASHGGRGRADAGRHAAFAHVSKARAPVFNVRLWPMLETVGQAGWCTVIEENGRTGASACGGVATAWQPFVMVQGDSVGGSHRWITVAVTLPEVAGVLVEGKTPAEGATRASTTPLPGLPYGLRGTRIVTRSEEPSGRLPRHQPPGPRSVVPLNTAGQPISYNPASTIPFQGAIRSWRFPGQPPRAPCELHASGVSGLAARGGKVMSDIRAYPDRIFGRAFLPCIDTEYQLHHMPVDAEVLLDAAHPGTRPAAIPGFKPVPGAPGFFSEGGALTARRAANVWLIARQGTGLAQRMRLLRHLTATVRPYT